MSKIVLITIIVVLLVVFVLGIYIYLIFGNNKSAVPGKQNTNPTSFEIQGMKVEVLKEGSGMGAKIGDYVTAHYVGALQDGKEFDSSIKRNIPFTFQLGQNRVIKGWDLGLVGMKVGEKRKLTIPPELAYGLDGFPPTIPQKSILTYVIDLLSINPSPQQ